MKKTIYSLAFVALAILFIAANKTSKTALTSNFIEGDTQISSINALSFGPEGILFIGDSKNAAIYALDTKDTKTNGITKGFRLEQFDTTVANVLGTTKDQIKISDLAVNPISKAIYIAVNITDGTPVLLRVEGENIEHVSLKNAHYSKLDLVDPVAEDALDHRERPLRSWAISDMMYHEGKLMISGLSNKEFSSTFRSIPFPFTDAQDFATLEIYHAAHGRYETYAPIKAFNVINIENEDYLLASYTCTPLVLFPMADLKGKNHIKGRTVAELGAGNSPLDMITFEKDGQQHFFMSNTNRPVMRIEYDDVVNFKESLTEEVSKFAATEGVTYDNLPFVYVLQMDNLDDENVVFLQRASDGNLVLKNRSKQWM